jgi:hypothetical protein
MIIGTLLTLYFSVSLSPILKLKTEKGVQTGIWAVPKAFGGISGSISQPEQRKVHRKRVYSVRDSFFEAVAA